MLVAFSVCIGLRLRPLEGSLQNGSVEQAAFVVLLEIKIW